MKFLKSIALLIVTATGAQADGTYDSTGTIKGQAATVITALSETHMVMSLPSSHDTFAMAEASHPFSDMTGTCNGAAEVNNGAVDGQGVCVYENTSGETMVVRWTGINFDAQGAFHGQWLVIGGTGSLTGSTGGGNFISKTDRTTGVQDVTLTGAITIP